MAATRIRRLVNWEARWYKLLSDYIEQQRAGLITFSWDPLLGDNCLTLSSKAVLAVTGVDYHKDMLGDKSYSDAIGAYRRLRELGYNSLDQLFGSLFPSKPIIFAQPGDLVTLRGQFTPGANIEIAGLETEVAGSGPSGILKAGGIAAPPYFYAMLPEGLGRGLLSDADECYSVGWGEQLDHTQGDES